MEMSQLFTKERREKRQKFYQSYTWKRIRQLQLRKSGLCEICLKSSPKRLSVATVCDHIDPGWESWFDFVTGPFQSLCEPCHRLKIGFYDIPEMIKKQKTRLEVKDI